MSALDIQEGGEHYKTLNIQPIEYIHANGLDFFQGNIVKYATRHKTKNGVEDLKKVIHYAQLAIELQYAKQPEEDAKDWIEWRGGECPVREGTLLDVRYRDGKENFCIPALTLMTGRDATIGFWSDHGSHVDIVAYRLSREQK